MATITRRNLGIAAAVVALLLTSLSWTTWRTARSLRAVASTARQGAAAPAAQLAWEGARRAELALGFTWLAALLLGGVAFYAVREPRRAAPAAPGTTPALAATRDLALVDELTGLHNRRGFLTLAQQQIKLARRNSRELVLLFIDMDDFKQINDRYGHRQGDVALQRAAQVLRATFRDSDIVARFGGDEFVVLATDTGSSASIIQRLRRELMQRNEREGYPYMMSFSVGTARFDPEEPPTIDELLHTADTMLYEQKRQRPRTPALAD